MEENINALDEVNKGASIGMEAISFTMDKAEDANFIKVLKGEYDKYKAISEKIDKIYKKYNDTDTPHEVSPITKTMTWWGIEMKTFNDKSNSKIAELLVKGTNMGIIEGRRILNNKNIGKEVEKLVDEFVRMQEDSLEILKEYL